MADKKTDAGKPVKKSDAAKPKPPARPKKPSGGDGPAARVRMYRHGLGDCFLLSFPRDGKRDFRVLIDCGVIQGTPAVPGQPDVLERVVADLKAATTDAGAAKPTIDVLVATHEHWDHLAGFAVLTKDFEDFDIGEVWLAWTEDPKNPVATRLRKERVEKVNALKLGLTHARAQLGVGGMTADVARDLDRVGEVLSFFGVNPHGDGGLGATADGDELFGVKGKPRLSVGEAMDWCRKHTSATVHFWTPGEVIDLSSKVEGLRVFVLGPPTDLKQLTKDLPTKKGRETYEEEQHLAAAARTFFGADVGQDDGHNRERLFERSAPFDPKYRVDMKDAIGIDFYRTHYFGTGCGTGEEWRRIDEAGLAGAAGFALALDSDTNNTSLALAFELGSPGAAGDGRVLLFPGDAQVGNWESWHADAAGKERVWKVAKKGDEPERTVTAKDLLARTVVYKVGHHGSHNATLRDQGLELMTHADMIALVPVDVYVAHEKKHWERMPFDPLMDALHRQTSGRVIVADRTVKDLKPKVPFPGEVKDAPEEIEKITVEGDGKKPVTRPLWVEYTLQPIPTN